jgi:Zn-finger nucleic acid-binding protein
MCGAPASTDAALCQHCGARLATVACPACFGMMFVGEKFCSHCGAKADRTDATADAPPELCPRCQVNLDAVVIGKNQLRECPRCEGIWADADSLQKICNDTEQQESVLGMASHLPPPESVEIEQHIRYLPCPICHELMNRVNFANCSHIIVDVCAKHGTWFDRDELRRIVEFIRAGGMVTAREREKAELEQARRHQPAPYLGLDDGRTLLTRRANYDLWDVGISAASTVLSFLLKR